MGNQQTTQESFLEVRGEHRQGRTLGTEYIAPSELRFTHDSISCRFQDGHSLEETFQKLMDGELQLSHNELPPLVVMQYRGYWFVVRGNRRLYLYQKLEKAGYIQTVKVVKRSFDDKVFQRQFTSNNMGSYVRIRGDPSLEQKLDAMIQQKKGMKLGLFIMLLIKVRR